jgi:hypothetical protein
MPFGYRFQQTIFKQGFGKLSVCRLPEAFNSAMFSAAQSLYNIYTVKLHSPFDAFYYFPPWRTGVFPLQTGSYAAFINITVWGNPFQPCGKLSPFLLWFFRIDKSLFFALIKSLSGNKTRVNWNYLTPDNYGTGKM